MAVGFDPDLGDATAMGIWETQPEGLDFGTWISDLFGVSTGEIVAATGVSH